MYRFRNRSEAGIQLADALQPYQPYHPVVLAIPRSGVETAHFATAHIECERSILAIRKLKYPLQQDASFGSIAEDGSFYVKPWVSLILTKELIDKVMDREKKEILRRLSLFRNGNPLPQFANRIVIIIDDSIITGSSILAALSCCRRRNPLKLIVAAPAGSKSAEQEISELADEVVILKRYESLHSVHQVYESYDNLTDKRIQQRILSWNAENKRRPDPCNLTRGYGKKVKEM